MRSSPANPGPDDSGEWLIGGGEMGDLVRSFDWSTTPLGPRGAWPQALRTAVEVILSAGFPMAILWGQELNFIYNDGYRRIAGGKHPLAVGRSTREVWPEVWDFNRPIFEKVMSGGETVVLENQLLSINRNDYAEDAYFTLSYSPIRTETGAVGGALVTLVETTEQVREERRLRQASEMGRAELQTTLHSILDEVWIVDAAGRVLLINDAVTRNLGVPPGHWADIHAAIAELEILNPDGSPRPPEQAPLARSLRGETIRSEREIVRNLATGELRWRELSCAPVRDPEGRVTRAVVVARDVTDRVRAEQELARSEARYRCLHESMRDAFVVVDMNGVILDCNAGFLGLVGYDAEEVKGLTYLDLTPEKWHSSEARIVQEQILARGFSDVYEKEYRRKDGTVFPVELRTSLIRDEDGNPSQMWAIVRDITERRRAKEELERLAQQRQIALDAARLGWWHYDPITWSGTYDARYREIFGVTGSGLTIGDILKRIHPDDLPGVRTRVDAALDPADPRPYSAEYRVIHADGSERWVEAHGLAIFEGEGAARRAVSFVGTVQDITARKQMEDSLRRAKEEAEAASRAKDRLIAVVSHELRTPLSPILTIASYLLEREDLPADLREDMEMIRRNVRQEARLVDDLLNLTRLSRGKVVLHQEIVNIHDLVHTVIGQFQPRMDEKGIELLVALRANPHLVWADPGRMQQVLSNLLDNAVKFTPSGGRVAVRSRVTPAGQVRVEIADTGIGIAPELVPKLFHPFEQGEGTVTRQFGGLGLGLVIARGIVDLHGGTITASSEGPGRGATIALELGAVPQVEAGGAAPPASKGSAGPAEARGRRRRILLVDDHADTLDSMSRLLRLGGYDVLTASNVRDAMVKIETEDFDLLVSDIGLPDGSGHDIMRQVSRAKGKPGIALSGFGHDDDVRHSREAGFARHMVKPVNFQLLHEALSELAN
ncbi:MAG: PAS domain S-box protein [Isosphaeraceae bacterium]